MCRPLTNPAAVATVESFPRDTFRTRLALPEGKPGANAAVHTFGDYLIFHPHLHVLAANGHFHGMDDKRILVLGST